MTKYEAMFIFPEALKDEALEAAIDKVKAEIEKAGGRVEGATRLGRRQFARPLKKQPAGQYAVVTFQLDGTKMAALQGRLKLNEEIFRVQVVLAVDAPPPREPVAAAVGAGAAREKRD
jgi:small subunit ribosomal protein S6